MSNQSKRWMILLLSSLTAVLVAGLGCGADAERAADPESRAGSGHDDHPAGTHADHTVDNDGDHPAGTHDDHGHAEGSDLDRSVEELFAAACEHGVPAHRCEECRYEVGVVKVPRSLIEQGVLQVARVAERSFVEEVELTGEIRFDERRIAHLGPRLPGIIQRVHVDLGQPVRAGAPLVEIDSPQLAETEAAYLTALAEHRLARRNYSRQRELREAEISSEREFLEAEQEFESTAIRVNSGRQKLLQLGITEDEIATLEEAGIGGAMGRYVLRAPFDGEVLDLHAVRGEQVEPESELLLFGDTIKLWVWADLYEFHLALFERGLSEAGLSARVTVRAYPDEIFQGRVDLIGRTMNEDTRTVEARITLDNPEGKLKPGMFAVVALDAVAGGTRTAVPAAAVLSDEGRDFVFLRHDDDYFIRRPVIQGRRNGDFVEIVHGLDSGQAIAGAGAFLLKSDVLRSKMGEGCAH